MKPTDIGALIIFFILVIFEMVIGLVRNIKLYKGRDTFNNIVLGLITTAFMTFIMVGPVYAWYGLFSQKGIVLFPHIRDYWWSWIILLFLNDILFYGFHFLSHISRLFWASHVVHHNSLIMNFTTSVRGVFIIMSYRFLFYTPLAIIGFKPVDIILMDQITFFYQLIIHTEIIRSWGFLEWFMNTPSHHRVHHASNPQYMDKNFAAIFIIWDRLFGTFAKEVEKPVYGLLRNLETENIIIVSFHEFIAMIRDIAKARSFSEVMNLLFNHPGWKISHLPRKSFLASLQTGS